MSLMLLYNIYSAIVVKYNSKDFFCKFLESFCSKSLTGLTVKMITCGIL